MSVMTSIVHDDIITKNLNDILDGCNLDNIDVGDLEQYCLGSDGDLSGEIVKSLPNIIDHATILEQQTNLNSFNKTTEPFLDTPPGSASYSPQEQLINDPPPTSNYELPLYRQAVSNPTYVPILNTGPEEVQITKKRKIDEDFQQSSLVKSEREIPYNCLSPESDNGQNSLKVYLNRDEKFYTLYNSGGKVLPQVNFTVEADKGFIFSAPDDSFICQKKNHFQVTIHLANNDYCPKFVATNENNYEEIRSFHIHIYGNKREAKQQIVQVEQSQSDRTKRPFVPQIIDLNNNGTARKSHTIGRLHFCDTTLNNQRKNGKPNPDQRYFLLNVALKAHTINGNEWTVCSMQSEKIIVRASNPSQFKQDVDPWQKVQGGESIYSSGNVGIRTDKPTKALDVQGDIKVTGVILTPSDMRVKENIKEVDSSEQLEKVKSLQMYNFSYKEDYADAVGMEAQERQTTGVLAQQVKTIIPDAVHPAGDVKLTSGDVVENFQTVNKDRLYMEGLGAVQELCKVADNLQNRIVQIETFNERLKQKRDSVRSTTSSVISSPAIGSEGSRERRPNQNKLNRVNSFKNSSRTPKKSSQSEDTQCSNRLLHSAIATLVFVMTLCLISILTLYILEKTDKNNKATTPLPTIITKPGTPAVTRGTPRPTIPPDVLIRPFCRINVCDEKCCLSSRAGGLKNDSHIQAANAVREESAFGVPFSSPPSFTARKITEKEKSTRESKNENIREIMADPYFITYNRSLAPFCLRNSCTGSDGYYRYLIKLDKTIQFRNIIVDLKLKNATLSASWLCNYLQGSGTDCQGTQLQHLPFRDELKRDIWSLPAGYFKDTIYTFRISSKSINNTCDLSQERMGIDFTEYDFHFKRLPSRTCPQ